MNTDEHSGRAPRAGGSGGQVLHQPRNSPASSLPWPPALPVPCQAPARSAGLWMRTVIIPDQTLLLGSQGEDKIPGLFCSAVCRLWAAISPGRSRGGWQRRGYLCWKGPPCNQKSPDSQFLRYALSRTGTSTRQSRLEVPRDGGGRLANDYSGPGCFYGPVTRFRTWRKLCLHNPVNTRNIIELHTLKWLIICFGSFASLKKKELVTLKCCRRTKEDPEAHSHSRPFLTFLFSQDMPAAMAL